jgi:hypothetical protein
MEYFVLKDQLYPINDDLYFEKKEDGQECSLRIGYVSSRNLGTIYVADITNQYIKMSLAKIVEDFYPRIPKVTIPKPKEAALKGK